MLDEVAAGRIEQHSGPGLVDEGDRERRVEAPYLQLVLSGSGRSSGSAARRAACVDAGGARRGRADRRGAPRTRARGAGRRGAGSRRAALQPPRHAVGDEDRARRRRPRALRRRDRAAGAGARGAERRASSARPGRRRAARLRDLPRRARARSARLARPPRTGGRRMERAEANQRHRRLAIVAVLALVALAGTAALAVWALAQRPKRARRRRLAAAPELAALASFTEAGTAIPSSFSCCFSRPRPSSRDRAVAPGERPSVLVRSLVAISTYAGPSRRHQTRSESLQSLRNKLSVRRGARGHARRHADEPRELKNSCRSRRGRPGRVPGALLISDARGLELLETSRPVGRAPPARCGRERSSPCVTSRPGRSPARLRLPTRSVCRIGPKGTLVAVSDGTARTVIVNALTGDARYVLEQRSSVTSLVFGPGARILASGGRTAPRGLGVRDGRRSPYSAVTTAG